MLFSHAGFFFLLWAFNYVLPVSENFLFKSSLSYLTLDPPALSVNVTCKISRTGLDPLISELSHYVSPMVFYLFT